jgi:2-hydroxychromene-2-carboxylate isomerase
MSSRNIEFWLGYGSTYSYLTVMRIDRAIEGKEIRLVWKPYNLTILMREKGFPQGPFIPRPEKLTYMWRDLQRRAQQRGLPYSRPPQYPVDSQKTVRVGCLAALEGWCSQLSRRVFEMNFVEGRAIGGPGNLEAALTDIGKDPDATIRRAHEQDVEDALERDTRWAIERGMFGSPHFLVDNELFWGDDRLEDAIEWCISGRLAPMAAL